MAPLSYWYPSARCRRFASSMISPIDSFGCSRTIRATIAQTIRNGGGALIGSVFGFMEWKARGASRGDLVLNRINNRIRGDDP